MSCSRVFDNFPRSQHWTTPLLRFRIGLNLTTSFQFVSSEQRWRNCGLLRRAPDQLYSFKWLRSAATVLPHRSLCGNPKRVNINMWSLNHILTTSLGMYNDFQMPACDDNDCGGVVKDCAGIVLGLCWDCVGIVKDSTGFHGNILPTTSAIAN